MAVQGRHALQTPDALGAACAQLGPRAVGTGGEPKHGVGALSLEKEVAVLRETGGLQISWGGISQALARVGERCQPTYQAICIAIGKSSAVTADETGWHVGGHSAWLWAFVCLFANLQLEARPGYDA